MKSNRFKLWKCTFTQYGYLLEWQPHSITELTLINMLRIHTQPLINNPNNTQIMTEHNTTNKVLFLRKCTWPLCVFSDLIYVVFLVPKCCWESVLLFFLSVCLEGNLCLSPCFLYQQHSSTMGLWEPASKTAPGEVSLEMQTGKWSIWEIVSCIWDSDNWRLPDTHTDTHFDRGDTQKARWVKSEGLFRVRYKMAVGVDCFGTAD